jgi:hypothetical protein
MNIRLWLQSLWNPEPYNDRREQPHGFVVGCALLVTCRYTLELLAPLNEPLDSVLETVDDSAEKLFANSVPGVPRWPDVHHATSTRRECAHGGQLHGAIMLINDVTHPAMVEDPTSSSNACSGWCSKRGKPRWP